MREVNQEGKSGEATGPGPEKRAAAESEDFFLRMTGQMDHWPTIRGLVNDEDPVRAKAAQGVVRFLRAVATTEESLENSIRAHRVCACTGELLEAQPQEMRVLVAEPDESDA